MKYIKKPGVVEAIKLMPLNVKELYEFIGEEPIAPVSIGHGK